MDGGEGAEREGGGGTETTEGGEGEGEGGSYTLNKGLAKKCARTDRNDTEVT